MQTLKYLFSTMGGKFIHSLQCLYFASRWQHCLWIGGHFSRTQTSSYLTSLSCFPTPQELRRGISLLSENEVLNNQRSSCRSQVHSICFWSKVTDVSAHKVSELSSTSNSSGLYYLSAQIFVGCRIWGKQTFWWKIVEILWRKTQLFNFRSIYFFFNYKRHTVCSFPRHSHKI
jgi:hypothetical protein